MDYAHIMVPAHASLNGACFDFYFDDDTATMYIHGRGSPVLRIAAESIVRGFQAAEADPTKNNWWPDRAPIVEVR